MAVFNDVASFVLLAIRTFQKRIKQILGPVLITILLGVGWALAHPSLPFICTHVKLHIYEIFSLQIFMIHNIIIAMQSTTPYKVQSICAK